MEISDNELKEALMIAYLDARKNERNKNSQIDFETNLESNLWDLKVEFQKRRYKPSKLLCFIITDPVQREVFAPSFRDRVVSHFIYNYLLEMFEKTFIFDSYSCRKGKGTLFGIERAEHHIKSCTDNYTKPAYALSLDISGYFMSIDKQILFDIVIKTMEKYRYRKASNGKIWDDVIDYGLIQYLIKKIIFRDAKNECIIVGKEEDWEGLPANKSMRNSPAGIGLIIGDLMSQMLSNIYLNELDQFIKRELKIKHYGRYVDDAFIFHEDKEYLKTVLPTIENFLETKLKLKLNKKKVRITDIGYDVKFLGACVKPHRRYVKNRTINSFKTKLYQISKKIDNKRLTIEEKQEIRSILNSYCGYFSHHRTYKIKRKCFSKANIGKYFTFAKDYNKVKIKK